MDTATHQWAEELKDTLNALKAIRDEVKVQVHLAGMDAKARFSELERRLDNDQLAARKNFKDLVAGFRGVKAELAKEGTDPKPGLPPTR